MYIEQQHDQLVPIMLINGDELNAFTLNQPAFVTNWIENQQFGAKPRELLIIPNVQGDIEQVLFGWDEEEDILWSVADLPNRLPLGDYELQGNFSAEECKLMAIGWGLGCYQFDQFKAGNGKSWPNLYVPEGFFEVSSAVDAISFVRNLVNMPANQMMPDDLDQVMQRLADLHNADYKVILGEDLLSQNFPTIYAVGKASDNPPRLLELNWGDTADPLLVLVGKGVCFDSGGLNIKTGNGMRIMKKDMGGAAHALGLAKLIMDHDLPLQLKVLIPAVENAISGNALRPGDIIETRSGITVEIDNTDAEGRLILCDALSYGSESNPDLMIDFATLTGAARVALGTEIPAFFANDNHLAIALDEASEASGELIWQLPLHHAYSNQLESNAADIQNSGGSYGGAITAAIFLANFVPDNIPWAHFDLMAWNIRHRPGRPIGGEAMGLFAVTEFLENRYG